MSRSDPTEHSKIVFVLVPAAVWAEVTGQPVSEKDAGFAWTTERPTAPGWYWLRDQDSKVENAPQVALVDVPYDDETAALHVWLAGNEPLGPLSDCESVEWAGPLRPPE